MFFVKKEILVIFVLSLLVYFVQSIAWPISPGRDFGTYLTYFVQIPDPIDELGYPNLMLKRTPITPLLFGITGLLGGSILLELVASLCFATSVVLVFIIAGNWNRIAAYVSVVLILIYPPYGSIFHFFSSDALFATAFLGWFLLVIQAFKKPTILMFGLNGLYVFFMIMIRPVSQLFLLFILFPTLLSHLSFKEKVIRSGTFLCSSLVLILLYSSYNYIRYDHFVIVRSFHAQIPMVRLFRKMNLIKPENGLASQEMAKHIQNNLLSKEPYFSNQISIDTLFSSGSARMWMDLKYLCDEIYGRKSEYKHLFRMSMEAIQKYPWKFLKAVLFDSLVIFKSHGFKPDASVSRLADNQNKELSIADYIEKPKRYIRKRLSTNSENQPIPIAFYELEMFEDTNSLKKIINMRKKIDLVGILIPNRSGSPMLAKFFNQLTGLYPDILTLIIIGVLGLLFSTHYLKKVMIFVCVISIIGVVIPVAGQYIIYQFRIPFDPVFIILAVIGVVRSGEDLKLNIIKKGNRNKNVRLNVTQ